MAWTGSKDYNDRIDSLDHLPPRLRTLMTEEIEKRKTTD
jgi:hypothetical protein